MTYILNPNLTHVMRLLELLINKMVFVQVFVRQMTS
jgi:hypothetical protein